MSGRMYSRRSNGRFQRATLANTFGLSAPICPNPKCRRFNPHDIGEAAPTHCHACGTALGETADTDTETETTPEGTS